MMNVEAISLHNSGQTQLSKGADQANEAKKKVADTVSVDQSEMQQVQPEELLQQIKALTEEGLYSVRFENDERADGLVVKIVDRQNDEVVRQFPAEEVLELKESMDQLRGNIVNTQV